jgi:hypothetical protein
MIFASVRFQTVFEKHFVLQINFIAQYLCTFRRIFITTSFNLFTYDLCFIGFF